MRLHTRIAAFAIVVLAGLFLSACAESEASNQLTGTLSKPSVEQSLLGIVDEISETTWTISGQSIKLSSETLIKGDLRIGDQVRAAYRLDNDGMLVAREIQSAILADEHNQDRDEIEFFGMVESITDGVWRVDGRDLMVTPQTEIKGLIEVGDLVKVHAFAGEGDMLIAREIEKAVTDGGQKVEFVGTVEAISDGEWSIDGRSVIVLPDTEIEDDIQVGDLVKVEAYENSEGSLVAHEIELVDDHDGLHHDNDDGENHDSHDGVDDDSDHGYDDHDSSDDDNHSGYDEHDDYDDHDEYEDHHD